MSTTFVMSFNLNNILMKAKEVSLSDWSNQALSTKEMSSVKGGFGHPHNIFAARAYLKRKYHRGGAGGTYLEGDTPPAGEGEFTDEVVFG